MPEGSVIARIGGDEYVAFYVPEEDYCSDGIIKDIKEYADAFNEKSGQPFYVELSLGAYEFIYDDNVDLSKMFAETDAVLYEQKKNRRASIKK